MGQADWSGLTGSALGSSQVKNGVTSGTTKPPGGGNFVLGFNSVTASIGTAGLFANQAGFIDMAYGAVLTFCVMRGAGAFTKGFAPFGFIGIQSGAADDFGYIIGASDDDPSPIVLRKGRLIDGLPNAAPTLGIGLQPNGCNMRRSSPAFGPLTWLQFMLNVAVNPSGEIIVSCKRNDLSLHVATSPQWDDIPGMLPVVDDSLQINTGSAPLIPYGTATSKAGLALWVGGVSRNGFFKHVTLRKQLPA